MKKLRIGVIGLGMGRNHVAGYRMHPQAEVVAAADLSEERLDEIGKEQLGIKKRYTDFQQMLDKEKLDIVSVATPNVTHKPLTLAALDAGCHVLCEKPMALNAGEAREMAEAAKKAGKRLMINFSFRFTEQSWALKKQVDSGILGEVYFGRTVWHRRRGYPGFGGHFTTKEMSGGGPLIDLGVHRLDLALWLMGYPKPSWVMGSTYDYLASAKASLEEKHFDVEDLAAGFIKFENGASLVVEASWGANIAENELMETRLLGREGGLVQRNVAETYNFEAEIYVEREGARFDMKLHPPMPAVYPSQFHFVDSILKDEPHVATAEEGIIVQELLDALYLSATKGEPVKVEN